MPQYTYEMFIEECNDIHTNFNDIISVESIGKSYLSKDIQLLKLGKGDVKIVLFGTFHGREYIATPILMKMCEEYAEAYSENKKVDGYDVKKLLDNGTIYFIPCVNPDGMDISQQGEKAYSDISALPLINDPTKRPISNIPYTDKSLPDDYDDNIIPYSSWKANARGVDLHYNFPVAWNDRGISSENKSDDNSITGTYSSEGFKGEVPISEPETKTVEKVLRKNEFSSITSYHTQYEKIFWIDNQCKDIYQRSKELAIKLSNYTGYELSGNINNNPAGGSFTSWTRREFGVPSFIIEMCPLEYPYRPYPYNKINSVYSKVKNTGLLLLEEAIINEHGSLDNLDDKMQYEDRDTFNNYYEVNSENLNNIKKNNNKRQIIFLAAISIIIIIFTKKYK